MAGRWGRNGSGAQSVTARSSDRSDMLLGELTSGSASNAAGARGSDCVGVEGAVTSRGRERSCLPLPGGLPPAPSRGMGNAR